MSTVARLSRSSSHASTTCASLTNLGHRHSRFGGLSTPHPPKTPLTSNLVRRRSTGTTTAVTAASTTTSTVALRPTSCTSSAGAFLRVRSRAAVTAAVKWLARPPPRTRALTQVCRRRARACETAVGARVITRRARVSARYARVITRRARIIALCHRCRRRPHLTRARAAAAIRRALKQVCRRRARAYETAVGARVITRRARIIARYVSVITRRARVIALYHRCRRRPHLTRARAAAAIRRARAAAAPPPRPCV